MNDELNHLMAEEIMKWEIKENPFTNSMEWSDTGISVNGPNRFNPVENMNHTMMCVEKFGRWFELHKYFDEVYTCYLIASAPGKNDGASVNNKSAPTAICQAIKEAYIKNKK